jgi:putative transferase (TIGR04331 family)
MNNKLLLLNEKLPEHVRDATIYVLDTDKKLRLAKQASNQNCEIRVLPVEAETREQFALDAQFERARYEKYIPLLSSKLCSIHKMEKPDIFWERIMGFTLLAHISNCRRIFRAGQLISSNITSIISTDLTESNLKNIPANEKEHREFFQYRDGGDEQLMYVHAKTFNNKVSTDLGRLLGSSELGEVLLDPSFSSERSIISRFVSAWRNRALVIRELIVRTIQKFVEPNVIALDVFWTHKNAQRIQLSSRGRLQRQDLSLKLSPKEVMLDWEARKFLSTSTKDADDFDKFFFASLNSAAPLTWLEIFPDRLVYVRFFLEKFHKLTHLINETLSEDCLLMMAEASERNATIVHSEHNYLQQQFFGNIVWYIERKVDKYLSMGWGSPKSKKIIPAGSYFNWINGQPDIESTIPILYITDFGMVKPPHTSAGYGESGSPNVRRFIKQKEIFFNSLSSVTKKQIYYRDYPKERRSALRVHLLDEKFCDEYFDQFGTVDTDGKNSITLLLNRCRILVVDYLSTSWLQGLIAGIPMIVLFNRDSYYLDDDHLDFFDDLITAGIFQTDPAAAANFLTSTMDNVDAWWKSSPVQVARQKFLDENFGTPVNLERKLLSFCI